MSKAAAILLGILAVVAFLAYGLAAHWLTIHNDRTPVGYLFALLSMWGVAVAAVWASRWRWPLVLLATIALAAGWWIQQRAPWDPRWIYLFQHAGIHGWLGLVFGASLLPGRQTVITRLALMVHGTLPDALFAYTRKVNWAWTLYFAAMTTVSLVLFFGDQAWWWSVLANFLTTPIIAALFVVEYLIRRRAHPDFEHVSLSESIRAFGRQK